MSRYFPYSAMEKNQAARMKPERPARCKGWNVITFSFWRLWSVLVQEVDHVSDIVNVHTSGLIYISGSHWAWGRAAPEKVIYQID